MKRSMTFTFDQSSKLMPPLLTSGMAMFLPPTLSLKPSPSLARSLSKSKRNVMSSLASPLLSRWMS